MLTCGLNFKISNSVPGPTKTYELWPMSLGSNLFTTNTTTRCQDILTPTGHDVFGVCANPLHRFHRIPLPPRFLSDDSVPDLVKIANLALDQLTKLYPPFKSRLHHKD